MSKHIQIKIKKTLKLLNIAGQGEPESAWISYVPPTADCKHGPEMVCNECTVVNWTMNVNKRRTT